MKQQKANNIQGENDYFLKIGAEKGKCMKCEEICKKKYVSM